MKMHICSSVLSKSVLLVASIFLFFAVNLPGAASAGWVKRYNGPGNGIDRGAAIAVDAAGYVYVTGGSEGTSSGADFAVIKYSPGGVLQWKARYNGPANGEDHGYAIAVDAAGNVYVAGFSEGISTGYDYAVVKYDANGIEKWVRRYNGSANGGDYPSAIAVDASGNVYVTGSCEDASTGMNYVTIKYNTLGTRLWVKSYNGPGASSDLARAMALDGSGNVYVTGDSISGSSDTDFATVKYNSNGKRIWVKRYNGPANGSDIAYALALDAAGNVYVTGESYGASSDIDFATVKYDNSGQQMWAKRFNSPMRSQCFPMGIAVSSKANVYVTGQSSGTVTGSDFTTVKYDTNGAQKWVRTYSGSATENTYDIAWGVAVDGADNVYVTGQSQRTATGSDFATVKYDTNGNEKWARRYNGPGNGDDFARSVVVDAAGNPHVVGDSLGGSTGIDYAIIKYNTN